MKKTSFLAGLCLLSLLSTLGCKASYLHPEEAKVPMNFYPSYSKADVNGVPVIAVEDRDLSEVTLEVRYTVGGAHDPVGKEGLAHAIEHLVFELPAGDAAGAPSYEQQLSQLATYWNAVTSLDYTAYTTVLPPQKLANVLELELSKLERGCRGLDEQVFLRERDVVRNERRERDLGVQTQLLRTLMDYAYPKGHPYRKSLIGSDESLTGLAPKDVCAFMEEHYRLENLIIVVSGPMRAQQVFRVAHDVIGERKVEQKRAAEELRPALHNVGNQRRELPVSRPQLYAAYPMAPRGSREFRLHLQIANGLASKMNKAGEDADWFLGASPTMVGGARAPVIALRMSVQEPDDLRKARQLFDEARKELLASQGEFEHSFLQLIELFGLYEDELSRPTIFADYAQFDNRSGSLVRDVDELRQGEKTELAAATLALLAEKPRFLEIHPSEEHLEIEEESSYVFQPTSGRHEAPLEASDELLATIEEDQDLPSLLGETQRFYRYELGNGMNLIVAPDDRVPLIHGTLLLPTGSSHPSGELSGASTFLPGIDDYDATTFSMTLLCDQAAPLMYLLSEGFKSKKSMLDAKQMERLRKLASSGWLRDELQFRKKLLEALYGEDHPYARTSIAPDDLMRLEPKTIEQWAKKSRTVHGATLVVTGRLDERYIHRLAIYYFGQAPSHEPPGRSSAGVATGSAELHIYDEKAASVTISMAFRGGHGVDSSMAARDLLSLILDHRLDRLRQSEGLSYGVYSRYAPQRGPGLWWIKGDVDPKKAAQAVREIRSIISELRSDPAGYLQEFADARERLMSRYRNARPTASTMRARLVRIARYGLEDDYDEHYARSLSQLRPRHIQALLEAEFSDDRRVLALRGPKAAVDAALAAVKTSLASPAKTARSTSATGTSSPSTPSE